MRRHQEAHAVGNPQGMQLPITPATLTENEHAHSIKITSDAPQIHCYEPLSHRVDTGSPSCNSSTNRRCSLT